MVIKEYGFLVYSCSYQKLGDLSTTLEMTVLFLTEKTRVREMTVHFYHHNHGLPCISSVTYDCISSTLVVAYHHAVACMQCPFQEILRVFSNPLNDRTSVDMTYFLGGIVISTKHSAWRNPLRRSSTLL